MGVGGVVFAACGAGVVRAGKRQSYPRRPGTLHVQDLGDYTVKIDVVARFGNPAEPLSYQPSQRLHARATEFDIQRFVHFLHTCTALSDEHASFLGHNSGQLVVELILNGPHDALHYTLERDEAGHGSILIDHKGQVLAGGLKEVQ
jgi:hypothetical protein